MTEPGVVIVGTGQAGVQLAASLREKGYSGAIDLIGDEPGLPYQRPPLSKSFLEGKIGGKLLPLRPGAWFEGKGIGLKTGDRVTHINRARSRVLTESGSVTPYSHLVLATGARNRTLSIPGVPADKVRYLRTDRDAHLLREQLEPGIRLAIIGGGFIGLEIAAMASKRGCTAVVIESRERILGRAVSPQLSSFFRDVHERAGVAVKTECSVLGAEPTGSGVMLNLDTNEFVYCDLVVIGVGVLPNDWLAADAGLAVDDGIVVDGTLQTSDPAIWAIGDCARFPESVSGTVVRLESVQNACDQARTVARAIVGDPEPHHCVPWFWSDQHDHKLQIAGLRGVDDDSVLRGSVDEARFSVFHFSGPRLTSVESIGDPAVHLTVRRLLAGPAPALSPDNAADPAFDLKALL